MTVLRRGGASPAVRCTPISCISRIAADAGRDPSEEDALFYTTAVRTYGLTAPLQP